MRPCCGVPAWQMRRRRFRSPCRRICSTRQRCSALGAGARIRRCRWPSASSVGLIGTLSAETAARYLNSREIDGVILGDGLGLRVTDALLTVLAEDARFRDLPIGVLNNTAADDERLPNLVRVEGSPVRLVERVLPFVRLQAFEGHLKRMLKSLDAEGAIDPETGLLDCYRILARPRSCRAGDRAGWRRALGGPILVRGHLRAARLCRRGTAIQPPGSQHRFRLQRAGWIDSCSVHRNRPTQCSCRRAPNRQRSQGHHGVAWKRPPRDQANDHLGDAETQRQSQHAGSAGRLLSQGCSPLTKI